MIVSHFRHPPREDSNGSTLIASLKIVGYYKFTQTLVMVGRCIARSSIRFALCPTADASTQQLMSCICRGRHEIFRMLVHDAAKRCWLFCKHCQQLGFVGLHTMRCVEDAVNKHTPGMTEYAFTLLQLSTIAWVVILSRDHYQTAEHRRLDSVNRKSKCHLGKQSPKNAFQYQQRRTVPQACVNS